MASPPEGTTTSTPRWTIRETKVFAQFLVFVKFLYLMMVNDVNLIWRMQRKRKGAGDGKNSSTPPREEEQRHPKSETDKVLSWLGFRALPFISTLVAYCRLLISSRIVAPKIAGTRTKRRRIVNGIWSKK